VRSGDAAKTRAGRIGGEEFELKRHPKEFSGRPWLEKEAREIGDRGSSHALFAEGVKGCATWQ
jgi:hypothetical protein